MSVADTVPLGQIEQELSSQLDSVKAPGEEPAQRARMSNLIIFTDHEAAAERIAVEVPEVVSVHPARVLLLVGKAEHNAEVTATVQSWCQRRGLLHVCSEQVTLRAGGRGLDQLPYVVRGLLIGDLPTNLWWAAPQPPPLAGPFLYELAEHAQQIIYDSLGWLEPARGVAATASWLERFERGPGQGRWRVASDLNWRRLKYWRRLLTQALDPATAPGALNSISEVLVEHGPHAVIQAWELVSWLASRLGWRVRTGQVQPGVEIAWQFQTPHGETRVRIRRLSAGPSELRRVRVACTLDSRPTALNLAAEDGHRLTVQLEGLDAAPRTVTVQPLTHAELVGRQLSDRERDPVFRESMAVAQVLAQSVLAQTFRGNPMSEPQNPWDQGSRYLAHDDPLGLLRWWIRRLASTVTFRGWLDTRTVPFPGAGERTLDTVAWPVDTAEPDFHWGLALEFQTRLYRKMYGRMQEYIGRVWQDCCPQGVEVEQFGVVGLVVNLTGRGTTTRRLRLGQTSLRMILDVGEINLCDVSAAATLRGITEGRITHSALALVPLMHGGGEPAIIKRWIPLAKAEPDPRRRGNYGGLARLFAEQTKVYLQWKAALEGWNMEQSKVVMEWMEQGREKGIREGKLESLLLMLHARFTSAPSKQMDKVAKTIQATTDAAQLEQWIAQASTADTFAEFRQQTGL